ncbi:hypothetical protein [Caldinitratiruptor microaerophilus]|uniref:Big-1 domain-containing protein n=1 Tax=Caldinitratiruptor microaerophilus TaxID=671077 RepID=A0AA35CMB9_9FIRM|nr:hypothetical protein [Caldinitratiruptor microaerophilus]BDG61119.1 hypothetical protein caldi_22090 [Caldinitratiruptor microaerophilus]
MKRPVGLSLAVAVVLLTLVGLGGVALAHGGEAHEGEESTSPAAPPAGAEVAPTVSQTPQLTLTLSRDAKGTGVAEARLTDAMGMPVQGAKVRFVRKTTFGELDLGPATTDGAGVARMALPVAPGQEVAVTAQFAGGAGLAAASAGATLSIPAEPVPARPGGLTTRYPNPWFVAILATVVGGVWFTYGWVFWTLGRIRRLGRVVPEGRHPGLAAQEATAD